MDTIIGNVLLFLKDSGLFATLEVLNLELESFHILNPDGKNTDRKPKASLPASDIDSREKLLNLVNNRNLDATNYPYLYDHIDLLPLKEASRRKTISHKKKPSKSLKAREIKIQNRGINNLMGELSETFSGSKSYDSVDTNPKMHNSRSKVLPSNKQYKILAQPVLNDMVLTIPENTNINAFGNLQQMNNKTCRSDLEGLSEGNDPEIGEIEDESDTDSKNYQPFYTNDSNLISNSKVWTQQS